MEYIFKFIYTQVFYCLEETFKSIVNFVERDFELCTCTIVQYTTLLFICLLVYQTYIGAMNERIRRQIGINNPFVFKHISSLKVKLTYNLCCNL